MLRRALKRIYMILRPVAAVVLALAVLVPAALYIALSLPAVQRGICSRAERELSSLLTVPVSIGHISITPFNRVTLHQVTVHDQQGDTAMTVRRLGAGVDLGRILTGGPLTFTYGEIVGLDLRLTRDSASAPLNIQPIIDAFRPGNPRREPTKFDVAIRTIIIRQSAVSYDVLSLPQDTARFDRNHIRINDIRADILVPRLRNDDYRVELRRLALNMQPGFTLDNLSGQFMINDRRAVISSLQVALPGTELNFGDLGCEYSSFDDLKRRWGSIPVSLVIGDGSFVAPSDFATFVPQLADMDLKLNMQVDISGTVNDLTINRLALDDYGRMTLDVEGRLEGLADSVAAIRGEIPMLNLSMDGDHLGDWLARYRNVDPRLSRLLNNLGTITLMSRIRGGVGDGTVNATLKTACGDLAIDTRYRTAPARGSFGLAGKVKTENFDGSRATVGTAAGLESLGPLTATADYDVTLLRGRRPQGRVTLDVASVEYRGVEYRDIVAEASLDGDQLDGSLRSDADNLDMALTLQCGLNPRHRTLTTMLAMEDVNPADFGILTKYPRHRLSLSLMADVEGSNADNVTGEVRISDLQFTDGERSAAVSNIHLMAEQSADSLRTITLQSDLIDGRVGGRYTWGSVARDMRTMVSRALPALLGGADDATSGKVSKRRSQTVPKVTFGSDSIDCALTVKTLEPLEALVSLPVKLLTPLEVTAAYDSQQGRADMDLSAQYLQQGKRLLENTALKLGIFAPDNLDYSMLKMDFTTMMHTQKGVMTLTAAAFGTSDQVDTDVTWNVARERQFSGDISVSTRFARDEQRHLLTAIHFNPGHAVFNDTLWTVSPSVIEISDNRAVIDGFKVGRPGQFITIDGSASAGATDSICLQLQDVNLDYVFETLDIGNAMFGGIATGTFYASEIFSRTPRAYTDNLEVTGLKYNHSLMGDGHIRSSWDPVEQAVNIHARIDQPNGRRSLIDGGIFPMADSLDLSFDADKIEIGFLRPFMSGFAEDVSGYASGRARLWGNFKLIDMVGDVYGEDVCIRLGFTNTSYWATDSVHFSPGRIAIDNLRLRDRAGNTGLLNGWVTHRCFKEPEFQFNITDVRDMLVYDVGERQDQVWYGRIFGSGSAAIAGRPGLVDIKVDMATAPHSTFTFVLSDAENAGEYNFITFRDRDRARRDSIAALTAEPEAVRLIKERIARGGDEGDPSDYRMNIAVDVNPNAAVTLVMDPIGGDRIRAVGNGNLRLTYDSANEDLSIFGAYTLLRGNYNFTLQDIIIKDFTIRDGSTIAFHGDPYAAQLDITAQYAVNANLSDLDESFLEDKELNRTNVPVHALLKVTGSIQQPDINFDLEFPTLTTDTYRKVRSIVNTEEMMNRQIIYLLALSRFYTPDYMAATRGNELVSVASSTISSQLSSMLGQLSDNWSIMPQFRSDRGDFSDVEVDLALSSHLLNNRLLLNGNFGYRDKALNNNSFIGDFDIEYLLNRSGSVRLKAYNRYNDQNYYVKSALTTQGVGVMFKREFDDILSFWRKLRPLPADTVKATESKDAKVDSVAIPDAKENAE